MRHRAAWPAAGAGLDKIDRCINFIEIDFIRLHVHFIEAAMSDARPLAAWTEALSEEDLLFVRRFVLSSGSLKALADEYGVSYPTVRARLDRLIAKVRAATDPKISDPFQRKLRVLVADGQIGSAPARELLEAYRAATRGGRP